MFSRYASLAGYGLLIVLAVAIGIVSLRYVTFNSAVAPDELRPNMEAHPPIFVAHTFAAAIALLVGVWQFMPRTRRSAWHRIEGRIHVGACLIGACRVLYCLPYNCRPLGRRRLRYPCNTLVRRDTDWISDGEGRELCVASTMDGAELRTHLSRYHTPPDHRHGGRVWRHLLRCLCLRRMGQLDHQSRTC